MRAFNRFRFPLLALGLAFTLGCSADSPNSPTAPPPSVPVPPSVGVNVTVTSSTSALEVDSNTFATLLIRATRADNGQPVPDLTRGTITTTLGNFGSAGGPQAADLELVNGQATVVLFPGATVGIASIRAAVASGVGFTTVAINEAGAPATFFLASVSPSTGSPQGGDIVTINGGGFSDPIRVTFAGIPAVIQSASGTQIRVTTPRCLASGCFDVGAVTPVDVSVTVNLNEEGQASDTLSSGFSYVNGGGGGTLQPTIFSVTPSSGPNEGGTQVTINGDGFEAPVAVEFGSTTFVAAQVVSVTRTRIVALSPSATSFGQGNLNQLVGIRVTNQSSGRTTTAAAAFRYGVSVIITSLAPGQGTIYGGDLVTIFGQGFDAPVAVDFGGVAQQPVSVSGTEVVVRTTHPAFCPGSGLEVHLVNIESGNGSPDGPAFGYLKPNIFSLNPSSGGQGGGTALVIGGANFGVPIIVDFSKGATSRAGTVTGVSETAISVTTPSMPDSVFDEIDCNDNADTQTGKRFIPTGVAVKVTDPVSGCTDTFEGQFIYNPSNTTCRDDIAPP